MQGPRDPCSDLKDDGDTCNNVVWSRCSSAHLEVSEVPQVEGEYSFVSETAGEGAECSRAPSADPEIWVIAWAEMECVRGPWDDCKCARFPGLDGNVSAPPWVKDECVPGSRGDGGKGPRVGKEYVEDSVFSLTRGKGGSRFLRVDDKELSTGKVPSAAVEKSLHFWEVSTYPWESLLDRGCSWEPSTDGECVTSAGEYEMDFWDFWQGSNGPMSLEDAEDLCPEGSERGENLIHFWQ